MNLLQWAKKLLQREDGSAMIEMALTCPIFIVMIVSAVNYAFLLQQDIRVADSARAGAEYAITPGNQTNTTQMANVATASAGNIRNYAATAVNVCTCAPGSANVSCSSTCPAYGRPALYAQVTATANLPVLFGTLSFPVSSVVRMRVSCPNC